MHNAIKLSKMGKLVEDVPPFTPGQNIRAQTYMYELPSRLSIHL